MDEIGLFLSSIRAIVDDVAATSARLLNLLSLLQTPREWPGSVLADRLGVSRRTVRRDIERLRDLGYPVVGTQGVHGGYRLVAGSAMPPLLLDDEEAVAIAVGLRSAAGQAVGGVDEAALRALGKLDQVLPARLRPRVRTLGTAIVPLPDRGPAVDLETLIVLGAAVANGERLRFAYRVGEEETRRLVDPVRLVAPGRRWYLVGHDEDRQGWRTFRVDRIHDPQPTGVRIVPRTLPAEDAAAYVAGWRSDWGTPSVEVEVTLHMPAEEVGGALGGSPAELHPIDASSCRLVGLRDDSMTWLAHRLVSLGCAFVVHSPPELVAQVREIGVRALQGAGEAAT